MAQQSKFSPEVVSTLIASIVAGKSDREACAAAGITHPTLYLWLREGRAGREPFVAFQRLYLEAERRRRQGRLDEIMSRSSAAVEAAASVLGVSLSVAA